MLTNEQKSSEPSLKLLAKELGFDNSSLVFENCEKSGFLGETFKVKIIGSRNKKEAVEDLVVKHVPLKEYHEKYSIYLFYHKEAMVYNKLLTLFDKLQEESNVTKIFNHIKVCKTILERKHEAIIMEDLNKKGFENSRVGKFVDLKHATYILAETGKFHALSFAMKKRYPEEFNAMNKSTPEGIFNFRNDNFTTSFIQNSISHAAEIVVNNDHFIILSDLEKEGAELVRKGIIEECHNENNVVTHGDLWTNNVVYKYNNANLEEVLLLDWQAIRFASPVLDVLFFILISVQHEVRSENFNELLNCYYKALSSFMRELHLDPDEVYSYETYCKDLKKLTKMSLIHVLVLLPIFSNETEDFEDFTDKEKIMSKVLLGSPKRSDEYISQVRGIMKDLIANKLL